jgi:hypothetical protein
MALERLSPERIDHCQGWIIFFPLNTDIPLVEGGSGGSNLRFSPCIEYYIIVITLASLGVHQAQIHKIKNREKT